MKHAIKISRKNYIVCVFLLFVCLTFVGTVSAAPGRPLRLFPFVQRKSNNNNRDNAKQQRQTPDTSEDEAQNIQDNVQDYDEHNDYDHRVVEEHDDDTSSSHVHHHHSSLLQVPSCCIEIPHNSKTTPVTTIVDTGAQVTVLSAEAARRCGVAHFMDQRYSGHATGVGNCRVLGRIPAGALNLHLSPTISIPSPPITVLDNDTMDMDLLLGLDFLREHQAILNVGQETVILTNKNKEQVIISFVKPSHHDDDDDEDDILDSVTTGGWMNQDLLSSRYDEDRSDSDVDDDDDDLDMSGV